MPGGGSNGEGSTRTTNSSSDSPPLPKQFESNGNWIEQYFIAYEIEEETRKRAILLTSLSQDVYGILMDLCFPDLPETKTFKEINEILKSQFQPVVCVYAERRNFYEARQNENESVIGFVSQLKKLSRHCKFGDMFKDVLRDRFVSGLLKGPLFSEALELEPTAKLEACIELVRKKEAAMKQNSLDVSMHYVNQKYESCHVCGDANHRSQSCKFKSYKCRSCNVKRHLAKVCKKKPERPIAHHYVDLDTVQHDDDANHYVDLDTVRDDDEYERVTWSGN